MAEEVEVEEEEVVLGLATLAPDGKFSVCDLKRIREGFSKPTHP